MPPPPTPFSPSPRPPSTESDRAVQQELPNSTLAICPPLARNKPLREPIRSGEQTQILVVCLQLSATLLTDSYSGSALGIKMQPQSRVPNLPYFEISRPATRKALPSISVTDFISFFRKDFSRLGYTTLIQ